MTVAAKRVRARDGGELVLVKLSDFQALLDVANRDQRGLPEDRSIVRRLEQALEDPEETVALDDLLGDYDAEASTH